jgi:hypothetical protein
MTPTKTKQAAAQEVPALDRNLSIKGYKSIRGMDGEAFNLTLLIDGKPLAEVMQEGHGGDNHYNFFPADGKKGYDIEREYQDWARTVTGEKYYSAALDMIVDFLIQLNDLEKQARKWGKEGSRFTMMLLSEPLYLTEGEEPNPYSTGYAKAQYIALSNRDDAQAVAEKHSALFYIVSSEQAVPDEAVQTKQKLNAQLKKYRRNDKNIVAVMLFGKGGKRYFAALYSTEDEYIAGSLKIREAETGVLGMSDVMTPAQPNSPQVALLRLRMQLPEVKK